MAAKNDSGKILPVCKNLEQSQQILKGLEISPSQLNIFEIKSFTGLEIISLTQSFTVHKVFMKNQMCSYDIQTH